MEEDWKKKIKPDVDTNKFSAWNMKKEEYDKTFEKQEGVMVLGEDDQMFETRVYVMKKVEIIDGEIVKRFIIKMAEETGESVESITRLVDSGSFVSPQVDVKLLAKQNKKTGEISLAIVKCILDNKQIMARTTFTDENAYARFVKEFEEKMKPLNVLVTKKEEFQVAFDEMMKGRKNQK